MHLIPYGEFRTRGRDVTIWAREAEGADMYGRWMGFHWALSTNKDRNKIMADFPVYKTKEEAEAAARRYYKGVL